MLMLLNNAPQVCGVFIGWVLIVHLKHPHLLDTGSEPFYRFVARATWARLTFRPFDPRIE